MAVVDKEERVMRREEEEHERRGGREGGGEEEKGRRARRRNRQEGKRRKKWPLKLSGGMKRGTCGCVGERGALGEIRVLLGQPFGRPSTTLPLPQT